MTASPSPLFCPRCRKSRDAGDGFGKRACPYCGESLVPQGYCPVCEDFWPLAVGTLCPKHDLDLESGPPDEPPFEPGKADLRWVTVGRFSDSASAQAPRIRLEAEGIPTFLEGERMGSRSMYAVATGGAKLRVPEHLAGDARIILSQTWTATAAALGVEELPEDEWSAEELDEPVTDRRTSLRDGLLLFLIIGLPVLVALGLLLRSMNSQP